MIRRLRRRHLQVMLLLALILPVLFLAALAARHPAPRAAIPAELVAP